MDVYNFPFSYRSGLITLNEHRTAAGGEDQTKLDDTTRVDRFDFSKLQQRDQREALHLLSGGDLGDATIAFRYLAIAGTIAAYSSARLDDRIAELMAAFNVEEAQRQSLATEGVHAFLFTGFTEVINGRGTAYSDPVSGEVVGYYVPEQFLARPAAVPIITQRRSGGHTAGFALELVCPDPRRYCQVAEAVVLNAGNGFSASCPNWTLAQGIAVNPVITIVLTAAGSATFGIDFTADTLSSLDLNLSAIGAGAHTVVIDHATGSIKLDGAYAAYLRTGPVTKLGAYVARGGATATATNTTNVTSVTVAYRQARG